MDGHGAHDLLHDDRDPPPCDPLDPPAGGPHPTPRRRGGPPVGILIAAVAAVVATERLSMLAFVTDAGPAWLVAGGSAFVLVNLAVIGLGGWFVGRHGSR